MSISVLTRVSHRFFSHTLLVHCLRLGLVTGLVVGAAACSKDKKPSADEKPPASAEAPAGIELTYKLSPEQLKQAEDLVKKVDEKNWRFPPKQANQTKNARIFTYLAATSEQPEVVGAALQGMYSSYSSHSKRKEKPDEDFAKVVIKHLDSKDDKLVARALRAARTGMSGKEGNSELVKKVVSLADRYKSGAGRYALIDALRVVGFDLRNDELMAVFESSLQDEQPYVLSYALQALYRATRSIKNKDAVKARALELAKHADPGVRGRALELLGSISRNDEAVRNVVLAALSDEHPYVRSEAAESTARLRYQPAIHLLMKLVDQKERNRYEIKGWTTLDGKPGRLHHDGSAWSYVQDAAINAIRSLSGNELKLTRIAPKQVDEGLAKNVEEVKAWYKANKSKIPEADAPAIDTTAQATSKAQPANTGAAPKAPAPKAAPAPAATPKAAPDAPAPKPAAPSPAP